MTAWGRWQRWIMIWEVFHTVSLGILGSGNVLAFRRFAMPNNIGALAMGTVQDLDEHGWPHTH